MYHLMANKKGITVDEKISISVYNKRFKSREARWVYDGAGQAAVMLIGLCFVTMLGGFTVYVVMTRQVRNLKRFSIKTFFCYFTV